MGGGGGTAVSVFEEEPPLHAARSVVIRTMRRRAMAGANCSARGHLQ
jgi:hypothetical protein